MDVQGPSLPIAFADFTIDLKAGELRKHGLKIKLQEQPFQILVMLLQRPGDVVTREEVQKKLWPNDTIVEFDHSIGTAIGKLRQALGDDPEAPRYVETLPKRGFRFIFPVGPGLAPARLPQGAALQAPPVILSAAKNPDFTHSNLIGRNVSHYRILHRVGGGGMGIVYKAEDTKLGRKVALKFLPTSLAENPTALARFQREARAASALNHPNICTIHDVDEYAGQPFIAMELMEGKTLKEMLAVASISDRRIGGQRPPLQLDALLDLSIQIADALEAAHAQGIIHRDIKPANIFVTTHGQAKVLDFGVAKVTRSTGVPPVTEHGQAPEQSLGSPSRATVAATGTIGEDHLTVPGSAMGTMAYMSPEQARGEEVDARTDLFSFGAVLYEMATGQQAFSGATSAELREAILRREVTPPQPLNPALDPRLQAIINKALEKDRGLRCQSAAELCADLKRLKRDTSSGRVGPGLAPASVVDTTRPPQGAALRWRWLAAGIAVVAALAIAYLFRPTLPPPQILSSMQITSDGLPKDGLATDGARLYFATESGAVKLYQVSTTGGTIAQIATSLENPYLLDISPDHSQLLVIETSTGVVAELPLYSVPVMGGSPRRLDGLSVRDAAWSPDGSQLFYSQGNGLYLANADGTASRKLATVEGVAYWPRWSPDGKRIRFSAYVTGKGNSILEISADGKGLHQLLTGWSTPPAECCGTWTPDGKYFFFQSRRGGTMNIWAIREGGSAFYKINHQPVQLTTGPAATSGPLPSLDGKKLFVTTVQTRGKLVRYDARSSEFVPYLNGISATCLGYSWDGQWIAFVQYPEGTLWRSKIDGSDKVQLTFPPMGFINPRWSPDGTQIAFSGDPLDAVQHTYLVAADGTGTPQLIPDVPGEAGQHDPGWSPDGKSLVFAGYPSAFTGKSSPNAIHIMDMRTRKVTTLPGSQGLWSPRWSPNGRYIAAMPNDSLRLMLYDLSAGKWSDLGVSMHMSCPQWSRDSSAIYFEGLPKDKPEAIFRLRLSDHRMEQVASLEHFRQAPGPSGGWIGLAPDDSPLLLEDVGTQDIYALELKLR